MNENHQNRIQKECEDEKWLNIIDKKRLKN